MTPTFFNAVQILTNQSAISGKTDGPIEKINFKEGFTDLPTEEAIQAKLTELQTEYDSKQYQRDRATSYPSIQEQLDMQYWDSVNGTTTWKDAIAKVKTDNPKPSE